MNKQTALKFYKDDYIVFSLKSDIESLFGMEYINVISIDPAAKNFALRFEKRTREKTVTVGMTKTKFPDNVSLYCEVTKLLDHYHNNTIAAQIVFVERQVVMNYDMIRLSQHCLTYYSAKYPHLYVVEVSPKLKMRMLNGPPRMNYNERKKWSVQKTTELLELYDDTVGKQIMKTIKGKLDDVADATLQSEAFFILVGYAMSK